MRKVIFGTLLVAFATFSQACNPCCGCYGTDTESLMLLLAGEKSSDQDGITYVSAEKTMEAR